MAVNKKYLFGGEMLSLLKISKKINISASFLRERLIKAINNGITINEKWFKSLVLKKTNLYLFEGEELTTSQIAKKINIDFRRLFDKIRRDKVKGITINEKWFKSLIIRKAELFLFEGENLTIFEVSEKINISVSVLRCRIKRGLLDGYCINEEWFKSLTKRKAKLYLFEKKELTVKEISKKINISYRTLRGKVKVNIDKGITIDEKWFKSLIIKKTKLYLFEKKELSVSQISKKININIGALISNIKKAEIQGIEINEKWLKSLVVKKVKLYSFKLEKLTLSQIAKKFDIDKGSLYIELNKLNIPESGINEKNISNVLMFLVKRKFTHRYMIYKNKNISISYIEYLKQNKIIFNEKLFKEMLSSLNLELFKNPNLNIREFIKSLDIKL